MGEASILSPIYAFLATSPSYRGGRGLENRLEYLEVWRPRPPLETPLKLFIKFIKDSGRALKTPHIAKQDSLSSGIFQSLNPYPNIPCRPSVVFNRPGVAGDALQTPS